MSETLCDDLQKFLDSRELFGWRLGLQRVTRLARLLGHPERRYEVIHIAGSNGKGSTAAMLEAVLRAAGYRTGLYSSPHMMHLTERIRIAGAPIKVAHVERLLAAQRGALEEHAATYFEVLTMVAFAAFAESGVEVAVVEVGLGGRLDATNIVRPKLCIISSIAREHQKFLGRTLAEIAGEKAGILKPRIPCVVGQMSPRAVAVIRARARRCSASLFETVQRCVVDQVKVTEMENAMSVRVDSDYYNDLRCNLLGPHQVNNTLCALAAVQTLRQRGFTISETALRAGLKRVDWPGRFQILPQRPRIILDVAHNPAGMKALVQTYRQVFPGQQPVVVLGVLDDKDYLGMVRQWRGLAARLVACRVRSSRGRPPADVYRAARKLGLAADIADEPVEALLHAATLAGQGGVVCVTGSHYLVGQLLAAAPLAESPHKEDARQVAKGPGGSHANPGKIA